MSCSYELLEELDVLDELEELLELTGTMPLARSGYGVNVPCSVEPEYSGTIPLARSGYSVNVPYYPEYFFFIIISNYMMIRMNLRMKC